MSTNRICGSDGGREIFPDSIHNFSWVVFEWCRLEHDKIIEIQPARVVIIMMPGVGFRVVPLVNSALIDQIFSPEMIAVAVQEDVVQIENGYSHPGIRR